MTPFFIFVKMNKKNTLSNYGVFHVSERSDLLTALFQIDLLRRCYRFKIELLSMV